MMAQAHKDKSGKTKLALFVYYSGHGAMDTTTKVICNEEELVFRFFNLETNLSLLTAYQNTFVVAVFDCCREQMPKEAQRGGADDETQK